MEEQHKCRFEKEVIQMATDIAATKEKVDALDKRINGNFKVMGNHIEDGKYFRGAIVAIAFSIVVQVVSFAYLYGKLSNQVEVNTEIIEKIYNEGKSNAH